MGKKHLQTGHFCIRAANDLRSVRPVIRSAGISCFGRRRAAILGRFACGICAGCREGGGRLRPVVRQKMPICRVFTGATGLEPATSGVTGHFQDRDMDDDGHRIALFMGFLGSARQRTRMVERSEIGRFAARLLPEAASLRRG
jgi:hypothetical protein